MHGHLWIQLKRILLQDIIRLFEGAFNFSLSKAIYFWKILIGIVIRRKKKSSTIDPEKLRFLNKYTKHGTNDLGTVS